MNPIDDDQLKLQLFRFNIIVKRPATHDTTYPYTCAASTASEPIARSILEKVLAEGYYGFVEDSYHQRRWTPQTGWKPIERVTL